MDLEQLCKLGSETLAQASSGGRSAEAQSALKCCDMDVEQLRKLASPTLARASYDGRLAKALLLR